MMFGLPIQTNMQLPDAALDSASGSDRQDDPPDGVHREPTDVGEARLPPTQVNAQ
jgi:hypothetical protein